MFVCMYVQSVYILIQFYYIHNNSRTRVIGFVMHSNLIKNLLKYYNTMTASLSLDTRSARYG